MKKAQKVAAGLITVIAVAAGIIFYRGYGQERTDDAQVDGHIISISSRVTGQVQRVLVRDNESVKKGQPLVELDANEVAALLAAARADLSAAEAALAGSQSDVAAALSRLRLAELESARVRKLFKEGVLAQAEVERAKGVAQANKIIGEGLRGHEEYLRYLWIMSLEHAAHKGETIVYIPTEANLPILEANRLAKKK